MATGTKRPKGRGGRKSQYGGQRKLPARAGWPDEVVVGKPVVENGDERLPLRVALVHRRPGAASLLHLRHRWSTPATAPHLSLPRPRHALARAYWRLEPGRLWSPYVASRERSRGSNVRSGAGAVWAGPSTVRAGSYKG